MEIVLRKNENPQIIFCSISLPTNATITEFKAKIEEKIRINSNRLKLFTCICNVKVLIADG